MTALTGAKPLLAGAACRCPNCGRGRLFAGYLTVVPACETCGFDLSGADSGDGPAVFVMMIVGFIIVFGALFTEIAVHPPVWLHLVVWLPLGAVLALALLRPAKGLMIAVQMKNGAGARGPMGSEAPIRSRAFPIGLTLATAIAVAILIGLGFWQLHRLKETNQLLGHIAALRTAPARPIGPLLVAASRGADVDYARVEADCAPAERSGPAVFRYALREGEIGWRVLALCRMTQGPYDAVLLDRGLDRRLAGRMAPTPGAYPDPVAVTGVLRRAGAASPLDPAKPEVSPAMIVLRVLDAAALKRVAAAGGAQRPAPYFLSVESERPAPPGIVPAALPADIPHNNFVYALTWFCLAGVAVWFYLAMLWRRRSGR